MVTINRCAGCCSGTSDTTIQRRVRHPAVDSADPPLQIMCCNFTAVVLSRTIRKRHHASRTSLHGENAVTSRERHHDANLL